MSQMQYPALTKPITPPGQSGERPHPEVWGNSLLPPQPNWTVYRNDHRYLYPSFTIDVHALAQPEASSVDRWAGYAPSMIEDLPRQQWLYPSFTADAQLFVVPAPPAVVPHISSGLLLRGVS